MPGINLLDPAGVHFKSSVKVQLGLGHKRQRAAPHAPSCCRRKPPSPADPVMPPASQPAQARQCHGVAMVTRCKYEKICRYMTGMTVVTQHKHVCGKLPGVPNIASGGPWGGRGENESCWLIQQHALPDVCAGRARGAAAGVAPACSSCCHAPSCTPHYLQRARPISAICSEAGQLKKLPDLGKCLTDHAH